MSERGHCLWNADTLKALIDERRAGDLRFEAERDRRLTELANEREKARLQKQRADDATAEIERENRAYKDEKNNRLREQLAEERHLYPTKAELQADLTAVHASIQAVAEKMEAKIQPLLAYVTAAQGRGAGISDGMKMLLAILGLVIAALSAYAAKH